MDEDSLGKLRPEIYDYIVADLGTDLSFQKGCLKEGAAKGVLIGSGAPWKRQRFCRTAEGIKREYPEIEWRGLLSMGDKKEAVWLSKELDFPVGFLGWQPLYEPLTDTGEELFLSLIRGGKN